MSIMNDTVFMPSVLTFIGIPGLETVQCWIGIPFCAMYIIALMGNSLLLIIIKSEPSLHEPMYIFLAMLGATDIALSTSIVPKMLGIFWFHLSEIYFDACLFQMWLIHTFQGIESGVLLAMSLDCYVAICYPLRHATIFTQQLLTNIGVGVTLGPAILVIPCLLLIQCHLKLYRTKLISHTYCEHMALVKLATEDVYINKFYGLFGAFIVGGLDFILSPSLIHRYLSLSSICPRKWHGLRHSIHVFPTYVSSSSSISLLSSPFSLTGLDFISHHIYILPCPTFTYWYHLSSIHLSMGWRPST